MVGQTGYEGRVEAELEICNSRIKELNAKLEQASPGQRKQYEKKISTLILNREALKRGLLEITDEGDQCCPCSAA